MPPREHHRSTSDPAARAGANRRLIGGFGGVLLACILPGLTLLFFPNAIRD